MQPMRHIFCVLTGLAALWGAAGSAGTAKGISMELNAADLVGEACRITFVVTNQTDTPVDKAIYETVLFSKKGSVLMLTLFDFGALPTGVPRVRQFQVSDTSCSRIGMVLINGANTCTVAGDPNDICGSGLDTTSRIDIALEG